MRDSISFILNGVKKTAKGADLFRPLSDYLRYQQGLTGTKVVCSEGDCGACTVMVAKFTQKKYESINSCIAQMFSLDGANLVTVEGLAGDELSEVQSSMIRNFGGQCGFCTPGIVMAITSMHEEKNQPTEQTAKNFLTGNLCRCTGYAPIIKAALDVDIKKHVKLSQKFPPVDLSAELSNAVHVKFDGLEYFAPVDPASACEYKLKNPGVIIFSGATDLGVQLNKGHLVPQKLMSLHLIKDLYRHEIKNENVFIGARVTLAEVQHLVKEQVPSLDQFLNIFASPQIKNAATLVGNLANASPIADMTPVLMSLDAMVEVIGMNGPKVIPLTDFYLGYKKLKLGVDEIIAGLSFKVPSRGQVLGHYKISQRRDLDISTVNASFNFLVMEGVIQSARVSLGGVAATTIRLVDFENSLIGKKVMALDVPEHKKTISAAITPLSDVRGSADYRKILAGNLFEKFVFEKLAL